MTKGHWTKEDRMQVKLAIDDLLGPRMTDLEFQEWVRRSGKEIDKIVADINKRIRKPKIDMTNSKITDDMVQRARSYDIALLFPEAKGGMVKCCFHDDNKPSASIKKGILVCFSCGKKADAISVYQQQTGVSFNDAVVALQ